MELIFYLIALLICIAQTVKIRALLNERRVLLERTRRLRKALSADFRYAKNLHAAKDAVAGFLEHTKENDQ